MCALAAYHHWLSLGRPQTAAEAVGWVEEVPLVAALGEVMAAVAVVDPYVAA